MTYEITTTQIIVLVALAVWDLVWRGLALWKAAKKRQKWWFVALLVLNTVGILPIAYLLWNRPEKDKGVKYERDN